MGDRNVVNLSVPANYKGQDRRFAESVKENLDVLLGHRGDALDRAVTFRDLVDAGVIALPQNIAWDGNPGTFLPTTDVPNLAVPPAPTNLSASGAFQYIILTWDLQSYVGHSHVEVWRYTSDSIADAVLIGTAGGPVVGIYSDDVGGNQTYYYWVRAVNQNGATGPFNSSAGTVGATAVDVTYLLTALTAQITSSQLASALATPIGNLPSNTNSVITDINESITVLQGQVSGVTAWASATTYSTGDLVLYGSPTERLYRSLTNSNLNNTPSGTTADNSNWEFVGTGSSVADVVANNTASITAINFVDASSSSASAKALFDLDAEVFDASGNGLLASKATLSNDYYTEAATDNAISAAITDLASETYVSTALGAYTTTANITSLYYTKTATDGAISAAVTDLASETYVSTALGAYTTTANITNSYYTKTATDDAIAESVNQLSASVTSELIPDSGIMQGDSSNYWDYSSGSEWSWDATGGQSPSGATKGAVLFTGDGSTSSGTKYWYVRRPSVGESSGALSNYPFAPGSTLKFKVRAYIPNTSDFEVNFNIRHWDVSANTYAGSGYKLATWDHNSGTDLVGSATAGAWRNYTATIEIPDEISGLDGNGQYYSLDVDEDWFNFYVAVKYKTTTSAVIKFSMFEVDQEFPNPDGSSNTVTFQQAASVQASVNDGLRGQYTVKIDTGGHIAGFGLASTTGNDNPTSEFYVRADTFALLPPVHPSSTAPTSNLYEGFVWYNTSSNETKYYTGSEWSSTATNLPFIVEATEKTINGVVAPPGVYIDDAYIRNGSIVSAKIGEATIDTANIKNGAITSAQIGALAVNSAAIGSAAINTAHIGNAQITGVKIGLAEIDHLRIGDNQVTIPVATTVTPNRGGDETLRNEATASVTTEDASTILVTWSIEIGYGYGSSGTTNKIKVVAEASGQSTINSDQVITDRTAGDGMTTPQNHWGGSGKIVQDSAGTTDIKLYWAGSGMSGTNYKVTLGRATVTAVACQR